MEILGTAVNLYQGDLLEGWYQEWCLYDRERLQNLYLVMLDKLVGYSEMHRKYENGIDYATRILQCDRAHEISHQRLMRLRYTLGDRAGALRQYENCAAALKEELGVAPSERTQQLCRQIREDHTAAIMPGTTGGRAEPEDDSSLFEGVIHRLEEVRTTLAALKNTVDESLLRLSQALRSSDRRSRPVK